MIIKKTYKNVTKVKNKKKYLLKYNKNFFMLFQVYTPILI